MEYGGSIIKNIYLLIKKSKGRKENCIGFLETGVKQKMSKLIG